MTSAVMVAVASLLAGCNGLPAAGEAQRLSAEHRAALGDTIRTLSDSVMAAISAADPSGVDRYLHDGLESAFGGAGGVFLTGATFRQDLVDVHRTLRGYQILITEQRVALLGVDGAVSTGWGTFAAQDTSGARARGVQAFTMAWARGDEGWKVIQLHLSSRVAAIERRTADQPEQ